MSRERVRGGSPLALMKTSRNGREDRVRMPLVEPCNTSGVLNTKTCHVIICIAKHLALVKTLICIH